MFQLPLTASIASPRLPTTIADAWSSCTGQWLLCIGFGRLPPPCPSLVVLCQDLICFSFIFFFAILYSFLAYSLNQPVFHFLTEFFLSLPIIDGHIWCLLPTSDGRDDNPDGFCFVYGILPFFIAFIICFYLLDRPSHSLDPFSTVIQKTLSLLFFYFLVIFFSLIHLCVRVEVTITYRYYKNILSE